MLESFVVIFIIGVGYWFYITKKQGIFSRQEPLKKYSFPIQGLELQVYLSSQTPLECLKADGLHVGEKFQIKTPPVLPHAPGCQCQMVPFSYTSSEVFQGLPRMKSGRPSDWGALSSSESEVIKSVLIALYDRTTPRDFETFCAPLQLKLLNPTLQEKLIELIQNEFANKGLPL